MKKIYKRKGLIALCLILILLVQDVPAVSYAKKSTTQDKLEEALKKKNELLNEMNKHQDELDDLEDKKKDLKSELKGLNSELQEVSENLARLEQQIEDKETEIEVAQAQIKQARETEAWQYACMVERIQYLYVAGEEDYLELLLSAQNFGDVLNYGDYFSAVADYDQKMLDDYIATRQLIETEEAKLQRDKIELENLYVEAEAEKNKVASLISKTSTSISKYSDDIEKAEEEARAYEAELKRQEEDIEALQKIIAEEKRLSEEAANAAWRDISEITFAEGDRKLLANIIYCEAGGECYEGKLAVGAVVINRVLSSKYPDTVVGVIYQRSQFSPVKSGRLELALSVDKANADCYRAADEAMSGKTNVGNCLFFRTPIPGLTGIRIGGHIFY